jgi:hypothetical protein
LYIKGSFFLFAHAYKRDCRQIFGNAFDRVFRREGLVFNPLMGSARNRSGVAFRRAAARLSDGVPLLLKVLGSPKNVVMSHVTNPSGKGGLGGRIRDTWPAMFARGEGGPSCTATSKRNKRRCRMPPMRGSHLCYWHGGTGGDNRKPTMPTSLRHLGNKETKRVRLFCEAEVERLAAAGDLHPGTLAALRPWIGKTHPADEARLIWMISEQLHGNLTTEAWRETLTVLGLRPRRPAPPPKAPEPEPEPRLELVELWGRGSRPPNGW